MNSEIPKVKCESCDGTGEVELDQTLLETLKIVRKLGRATASEVYAHKDFKDKVVLTAVNNRLDELFNLGFLTRSKCSRQWMYCEK